MNVVDINNLKQALTENNAQLIHNMSSTDIKISNENGNALSLKEDGLYLPDVNNSLDIIENNINAIDMGYATGTFTRSNTGTNISSTITIPINLNFTPAAVFVSIRMNAGTTGGYRAICDSCIYLSSLFTNPMIMYYDNKYSSSTGYTYRGIRVTIESFSEESIILLVESYKNSNGALSIGSSCDTDIYFYIEHWYAIG